MADLTTSVQFIKGIGPQKAKALEKLGILTLRDLIGYFPPALRGPEGDPAHRPAPGRRERLRGGHDRLASHRVPHPQGDGLVKVRAVDETGVLDVTFFNQTWLKNSLVQGETYYFYGKAEGTARRRQMASPWWRRRDGRSAPAASSPSIPSPPGSASWCSPRSVRQGLDACADILPDALPDEVRQSHHLCRIEYAYENIHFLESAEALDLARRRLAFEELFLFTIGLERLRQRGRWSTWPLSWRRGHGAFLPCPALHPDGRPAPLCGRKPSRTCAPARP